MSQDHRLTPIEPKSTNQACHLKHQPIAATVYYYYLTFGKNYLNFKAANNASDNRYLMSAAKSMQNYDEKL